jgi:hypothetical protein
MMNPVNPTTSVDHHRKSTPMVRLQFGERKHDWQEKPKKMRESVSGLVPLGSTLWVASDQTATVERLVADGAGAYGNHVPFRLVDFVPLPHRGIGNPDQEVDLEGIDFQELGDDTGYLWLIGSHSHARGKGADGIESLAEVNLDRNRCALIRIPVVPGEDHLPELVPTCPDPRDAGRTLTAGLLSTLLTTVAADDHFRLFFGREDGVVTSGVPGKDNGLDIEGLAVAGGRDFVGLRGPVLRGWAVILQLDVEDAPGEDGAAELRLRPTPDGSPYRKYFLPLGGLGIRELLADGNDLLVLAGPTMDLDDPFRIHRWIDGATGEGGPLVSATQVPLVMQLRTGEDTAPGKDHPEGITRLNTADGPRLLVAYDSPADFRIEVDRAVGVDTFPWPPS